MTSLSPDTLTFALVLIALALLLFLYTSRKRIPTLGCVITTTLILLTFLVLLVVR